MFQEVFSHIHPIVVHFPIVLIIMAVCYDLFLAIFKREIKPKRGFWLWFTAFLFAWIAIGTGPESDARGNTNIFHFHENLADLTTVLAFLVVAVRFYFIYKLKEFLKGSLVAYSILSFICAVGILSVGYFGGKMVYDQGIGVKMNGQYVNPPHSNGLDED